MNLGKMKLVYFTDPMCSTCYGFSPLLSKMMDKLKDEVELELVMGGLRPFNKETMKDLKSFLTKEWQNVHQMSDQKFNFEILSDSCFVYDTEPSCRAVMTMRELNSQFTFQYFQAMQKAFYADNRSITHTEVIVDLATSFDVTNEKFRSVFSSQRMKDLAIQEFKFAKSHGVNSFPTLALKKEEKTIAMAKGYKNSVDLIKSIYLEKLVSISMLEMDG